jgi:hypothetical protein
MVDWASAGFYNGFRLSEWAESSGHYLLHNPQLNFKGHVAAFCIDDLEFFSDEKIRMPASTKIDKVLQLESTSPLVGRDFFRYRPGQHGEKRQHARNPCPTAPCHVTSSMNIVKRFARLVGIITRRVPLCVSRHDTGQIRYITSSAIESTYVSHGHGPCVQ